MRLSSPFSLIFAGLAAVAAPAFAQVPPSALGVLSLSTSATVDVPRDLLSITFSTTRDGADAAVVQAQLKQAVDTALVEARKAARPGQLDVQTGNFALYPRHAAKGGINGWQGSAELIVSGRDMQAIGQLSGRISTLTVARVGYGLSREAREKAETEVSTEAIGRYRAKAADYAHRFGYGGYVIREVNVSSNDAPPVRPMPMMKAMAAASDESLPIEAGSSTVVVNVSGSVQMQ